MKKVDMQLLKQSANNLMFDMAESEYITLLEEFSVVIRQMELISTIPGLDDVEPMTFPFDVSTDYLRVDEAVSPLSQEEALQNASDVVDGQIRLPKVVG
ncbi:MAG: Asp-tRNA(Asn)/Glu-tRNA(Gln) amidotransferase GatCAB subunit C [Erysipelotrichaceae bacterium]|nr:Asp-tRNA(Asn)/Glu-tRNA(Gln) amidotransferase GatCAB subunit C [Erysipelotrichaceae bacterium]